MKEQDFNKIAPNGLMDLTEKVRAYLMKKGNAFCEKCGAHQKLTLIWHAAGSLGGSQYSSALIRKQSRPLAEDSYLRLFSEETVCTWPERK